MPKYSTGDGGGGGGDSCELCGRETSDLRRANVAGADLLVCRSCAPHGKNQKRSPQRSGSGSGSGSGAGGDGRTREDVQGGGEVSRKKRAAQNTARMYDASRADGKRFEEGTNYEKDRLPYLVSDYGEIVASARQEAGLTVADLAAELDADESDLDAVEQGRATRAGVGGSLIRALEERLDVTLVDE
jgi:ribosome-binding protein aMBF1 (putative translation factor)